MESWVVGYEGDSDAERHAGGEPGDAGGGCLFCRISDGSVEITKLYEDDLVLAFDIPREYPWRQAPVHFLVISREHLPSAAAIRCLFHPGWWKDQQLPFHDRSVFQ